MINIQDFAQVEMRVGMVEEATAAEGSEKLIRLKVNFGTESRTIFTGVKQWYGPDFFVGRKFVFVTNLEPKKMMGEESAGMIMAAEGTDGVPIFLVPEKDVEPGAKVR